MFSSMCVVWIIAKAFGGLHCGGIEFVLEHQEWREQGRTNGGINSREMAKSREWMLRVGKEKERWIHTLHGERQPEKLQADSGQNYGGEVEKSQKKI